MSALQVLYLTLVVGFVGLVCYVVRRRCTSSGGFLGGGSPGGDTPGGQQNEF
jgi:hypothetical protein